MNSTAPVSLNLLTLAITNFASLLYTHLDNDYQGKNFLFSPLSLYSSLSMTGMGAHGRTHEQIMAGLHLQNILDIGLYQKIGKLQQQMLETEGNSDESIIKLANGIYAEQTISILKSFIDLVKTNFNANVSKMDFLHRSQEERIRINNWVSQITNQKIENLIPEDKISADTRLILVNAIYLNGIWKTQFNSRLTKHNQTFYNLNGGREDASTMSLPPKTFEMSRSMPDEFDCSTIRIPLNDKRFSVFISLPNNVNGLPKLEKKLAQPNNVYKLLNAPYYNRKIILEMPKFRLESQVNLMKVLNEMGMSDMFSNEADFRGITGSKDLKISDIIHKSFLQVDEKGVEAAASTSSIFVPRGIFHFLVNRPFLLVIGFKPKEQQDYLPAFIGRVIHI